MLEYRQCKHYSIGQLRWKTEFDAAVPFWVSLFDISPSTILDSTMLSCFLKASTSPCFGQDLSSHDPSIPSYYSECTLPWMRAGLLKQYSDVHFKVRRVSQFQSITSYAGWLENRNWRVAFANCRMTCMWLVTCYIPMTSCTFHVQFILNIIIKWLGAS